MGADKASFSLLYAGYLPQPPHTHSKGPRSHKGPWAALSISVLWELPSEISSEFTKSHWLHSLKIVAPGFTCLSLPCLLSFHLPELS